MRKSVFYVIYLMLHAMVWAGLFWLLPLFPNHSDGNGWEYYLNLLWVIYPAASFCIGICTGCMKSVPTPIRFAAGALLALIGIPAVLGSGICEPAGLVLYLMVYGSGVLLGIMLRSGLAQSLEDRRTRQEKRTEQNISVREKER